MKPKRSGALTPAGAVDRILKQRDFVHLPVEQEGKAVGFRAAGFVAACAAAGYRHVDDCQFADDVMEPVGDFQRGEFRRRFVFKRGLPAIWDRPRKRGFKASEHGGNPLCLLCDTEGIASDLLCKTICVLKGLKSIND